MNGQEWDKIIQNWSELCTQHPNEIVVHLFHNNVITTAEKQRVEEEKRPDQMEKLVYILRKKDNGFSGLLKALEDIPVHSRLAETIRKTESASDASLKSEGDPSDLISDVRAVCAKYIVNKKETSTKLSDIRDLLVKNSVFKEKAWKNKVLEEFMRKEYIAVKIRHSRNRTGKTTKKEIWCQNIAIVDPEATTKESDSGRQDSKVLDARQLLDIKKMNALELKDYLQSKMEEENLSTDILEDFVKQEITGKIFLSLKEEDFKGLIPQATFGIRRFLSMLISENNLPSPVKRYKEYLRKFDNEVTHTNKYSKGHCVDTYVNTGGKRTSPVRNFHIIPDQDKDQSLEYIGSEVVPFVSACLNDRHNGTIYFGICPSDNEQYKQGEIIGINLPRDEVQAEIRYFFKNSFLSNQQNVILSTVRDARFVPVISEDKKDMSSLWVVEVDVVPLSYVLKYETIRIKLDCLPIHAKKRKSKEMVVFRFSSEGTPTRNISQML